MIDFKKHGFSNGNVHMKALDIYPYLDNEHFYRDDGAQKDLKNHTIEVYNEFKTKPRSLEQAYGRCIKLQDGKKIGYVIFYQISDESGNVLTRENHDLWRLGHEETHVLNDIVSEFLLDFELEKIDIHTKSFFQGLRQRPEHKQRLEEKIAELGGYLAVFKKNPYINIRDAILGQLNVIYKT